MGPACVLTHATAALSFIALQFSQSDLIRTFGEAGLLATVIALFAVLMLPPLLGMLLLREEADLVRESRDRRPRGRWLRAFCAWIAGKMVQPPLLYRLISMLVVSGLGLIYTQLPPRYRLADQIPDREQAVQAGNLLDAKLHGANPIDVLVQFPKGASLYAPQTLAMIDDVQTVVEKQAGVGNVWSLDTLQRWLAEKAGRTDIETLKQYVNMLPKQIIEPLHRAAARRGHRAGPRPRYRRQQAAAGHQPARPVAQRGARAPSRLQDFGDRAFGGRRAQQRGDDRQAQSGPDGRDRVRRRLHRPGVPLLHRHAGRASCRPSSRSSWPARCLWLLGKGLQFASIVALIVSFGLGLSATIHFLNRMRAEDKPETIRASAVERATVLMGPPLILTSVVLACGLAVTVLSDLPSLRLFGWLSALAMLAALTADLTILRPTITLLRIIARRLRGKPARVVGSADD